MSESHLDADLELTLELPNRASQPSDQNLAVNARPERDAADIGIKIRELAWADVTRVAALEGELFGASAWTMGMLTEELRGAGRWYIGAHPLDDGGHTPLVGYAGIWFDGEHAHIMTIGVEPQQQGKGIGQALMARLVAHARELGARSMLLEVAVNNPAAITMYERTGFERIGLRKRYYQPEDVDAFTMQLRLKEDPPPPIGDLPESAATPEAEMGPIPPVIPVTPASHTPDPGSRRAL